MKIRISGRNDVVATPGILPYVFVTSRRKADIAHVSGIGKDIRR